MEILLRQTNYSKNIIQKKLDEGKSIENIIEEYLKGDKITNCQKKIDLNKRIMNEIRKFCDERMLNSNMKAKM